MSEFTIRGYVSDIRFRNEDNGYTVFHFEAEEYETMCVGKMMFIDIGAYMELTGTETLHPMYGEQFEVKSYRMMEPEDLKAVERYLGSGAIRGIGPVLAKRIIDAFGEDTVSVMESDPVRLASVRGISKKSAVSMVDCFIEKSEQRAYIIFMQKFGLSISVANRLYKIYGTDARTLIQENPYRIIRDVPGIGFKTADRIAEMAGIALDSEFRIRAGVEHVLREAMMNGDTYVCAEPLRQEAEHILKLEVHDFDQLLDSMRDEGRIVRREDDEDKVYLSYVYQAEYTVAQRVRLLDRTVSADEEAVRMEILEIEKNLKLELDDDQRRSVLEVIRHGFTVITGGPGTGKTTLVKVILEYFLRDGKEVALAAPTGRAAKRMTEATGFEAKTIHRLLEVGRSEDGDSPGNGTFGRNEEYPIEADILIVDEASMIDIFLMKALLRAVAEGTRFVLVGDHNQLPSVGPGNVLLDILDSEVIPTVRLQTIYRQDEDSTIVTNAYRILNGEDIDVTRNADDFYFIRSNSPEDIIHKANLLIGERLGRKLGLPADEFQVLSPTRQGSVGVEALNRALQEGLNPSRRGVTSMEHMGRTFREGDKVMQVKNNYNTEWELVTDEGGVLQRGAGVFNGDVGTIQSINAMLKEVTVLFDDKRRVIYPYRELEEIELAYAVTVHKSQGSEYPAIVLILYGGPRLLLTRNILYTAVTRAKRCVVVLGSVETFKAMIANESMQIRRTSLTERLLEAYGLEG